MEDNRNKRLIILFLIAGVTLFAIGVVVWFFFFSSPTNGKIDQPGGGLPSARNNQPRSNFILGNNDTNTSSSETVVTPAHELPLVKVWDKPTAGETFASIVTLEEVFATTTIKRPKGTKVSSSTPTEILVKKTIRSTSTLLMFVDRTTGYVYGYNKTSDAPYQISNTTIPGVYDAYIFNDGKSVLMRYLDNDRSTIITVIANIPQVKEGDSPLPLIGAIFLPKNVASVAVSASSHQLSYLIPNTRGSTIYTINSSGQTQTTATSPFSEWSLVYGGENLYATSKPSAYIEGSTISLPSFAVVNSKKTGLISIPSPEGKLLNSMWSNTGLLTYIFNKGNTTILPVKTLAPKCTWLHKITIALCAIPDAIPKGVEGLPDDWYQGRYMFNDSLQFIDTITGTPYPLYTFDTTLGQMDLIKLTLSPDDKDISFIRKQDESLWLLKTDLLTPTGE